MLELEGEERGRDGCGGEPAGGGDLVVGALLGPILLWTARKEEKRLANGFTYEPKTIIERSNWAEAES